MKDDTPINPGSAEEFDKAMQLRYKELTAEHETFLNQDQIGVFARSIGGPVTKEALDKTHP